MWRQAVIPIVLFGLIVLSSCHELLEDGENGLLEKLGALGSIRDRRSSINVRWNQFEELANAGMKKRCEENGGAQAFAVSQNANAELNRCMKATLDITVDLNRLGRELVLPGPKNYMVDVVTKACRVHDKIDECARTAMESYKPCYNAEERVAVEILQNISTSILDYLCKDNGAELLAFIRNHGLECFGTNMQGIAECWRNIAPEVTMVSIGGSIDPQAALQFLKFEGDECRKVNSMQTCVKENLEKCNEQQPARFINGFFDAAKNPTPCSSAPRASSIPSASVILSALAMAYLSLSQKWF